MTDTPDFQPVFDRLKAILASYATRLNVVVDQPGDYQLNGIYSEKYRKVIWFGGVQIKKNYVSFHLIPVYAFPELLQGMSPALKKRMQGKSCFNFTRVDDALFQELSELTQRGYERSQQEGYA